MRHPIPAVFYAVLSALRHGTRRRRRPASQSTVPHAWRHGFLLLIFFLLFIVSPGAQESDPTETAVPAGDDPEEIEPEETRSLTEQTLAQDILTASFRDLIAWNATLDLSTRGGRRDLENRLFDYYGIERPAEEAQREGSEIIIEAARSSRYFTIDAPEENYLVMRGGVVVQMREAAEDVSHRIEADQVVYNQTANTLSAMGDITYTVERDESIEVFTGHSLQFRLDSWDGIFLDGESRRRDKEGRQQTEEEFAVRGSRLSRSPNEIIVVEDGSITSSLADPPNYSIDATKIWVLAPGEWGIQNAVLKVGRVPLFYFPFFFLPGDKLFFHPAVGYEPRRGSYIQTTTYLIGAREQEEQPFSLLQLTENVDESLREIEGLFLVLPENPLPPERPDWYFKIMADIYTNLGAYVGTEADLPDIGLLQTFFVRAGIGASRTVFSQGDGYTPFYVNDDGEAKSNWESGWLIGRELPFRYEAELQTTTSLPFLSLSLDLLLLSDPEFRRDFGVRSEQFDWSVVFSGLDKLEPEQEERIESYTWRLQSSISPPVPSLSPWVTSLTLERLNASLEWRSRQWPEDQLPLALRQNPYTGSGEAAFFYPSEFLLPDASVRLQGELFAYPDTGRENRQEREQERGEELRPPWEQPEEPPDEEGEDAKESRQTPEAQLPPLFENQPGILGVTPLSWRLRYQIVPSITISNVTDSDEWETPQAIDSSVAYSTMQHLSNYQLSHDGYLYDRLVTFNGSLLFALKYQELLEDKGVTEEERENLEEQAYRGRSRRLTQSQSIAYAPLRRVERLEESQLRYDISTLLYERAFSELSEFGEPVYEEKTFRPTKEYYRTHKTTAELRLKALRATQAVTLAAALPPLDGRYDASATAITGPLSTQASTSYVEDPEEGWLFEPLQTRQTLEIIEDDLSLSQRFVYEIEEERFDRSVTTLDAWIASFSYEARHSPIYEFDPGGAGWTTVEGEEEFQPYSFTTTLNGRWEPAPFWRRRIYPEATINAAYEANLLRFTESALRLSYGFSFSVYRFLDLQFEAVTVNDFTYQYFPSLARRAEREERNLFRDMADSLALWDREKREESFFKLESVRFSAIHDLQDWELTVSYEGRPTLESGGGSPPRYRWESLLSIFLRWRPISEIQSTITYDDGDLDFEN